MKVVSVAEMRAMESAAIASGVPEYELMLRAGKAAAEIVNRRSSGFSRVVILAGAGNNAGDALVAANHIALPVVIFSARPPDRLKGAAARAFADLNPVIPLIVREELNVGDLRSGDLLVEGLLGTGFSGTGVTGSIASFIRAANASRLPVIALDLPGGLDGDSGRAASDCVQASLTITFGAPKRGLLTGDGPRVSGLLRVVDIGVDPSGAAGEHWELFTPADCAGILTAPSWDCHKNSRGSLAVCAGSREYSGAPLLTVKAALRGGAGIVRLITTRSERISALPAAAIVRSLEPERSGTLRADALTCCADYLENSSVLVAGPGWGDAPPELLAGALAFHGRLLLDADALNLAARCPELWWKRPGVVITPHPGEAARLAEAFSVPVSEDRCVFAAALAEKLGAVTVLKGFRSVVAAPDGRRSINSTGGPELATAGSGDVLSGVIGALLARGLEPFDAARIGVLAHGLAGEACLLGVLADDLPDAIPEVMRKLSERRLFW